MLSVSYTLARRVPKPCKLSRIGLNQARGAIQRSHSSSVTGRAIAASWGSRQPRRFILCAHSCATPLRRLPWVKNARQTTRMPLPKEQEAGHAARTERRAGRVALGWHERHLTQMKFMQKASPAPAAPPPPRPSSSGAARAQALWKAELRRLQSGNGKERGVLLPGPRPALRSCPPPTPRSRH